MANINVSQQTINSFAEMGVPDIAVYLDTIAENHEVDKLDKEFKKKTKQQKEDLLNP